MGGFFWLRIWDLAGILNLKKNPMQKTGEQTIMKPILGITMGDICGIGPEITVKALLHKETYAMCRPVVIGSAKAVCRALQAIRRDADIHMVEDIQEAVFACGTIDVWDIPAGDRCRPMGRKRPREEKPPMRAIEEAIRLAMAGKNRRGDYRAAQQGGAASGRISLQRAYGNFCRASRNKKIRHDAGGWEPAGGACFDHVSLRGGLRPGEERPGAGNHHVAQNACGAWESRGRASPWPDSIRIAAGAGCLGGKRLEEISPAIAAAQERAGM